MLRIVHHFTLSNKIQTLIKFNALIFALSYHGSETISNLAKSILLKMPKKHQVSSLALKLFS